jgi:phosphoribosyl 1,2-cyclic phosphodiesterase
MASFWIRYWGVRGSIAVPGPSTMRYGGNTSCVELKTERGRLIVDAGTGLARLGATLAQPEPIHLFLTHLHWDHIQGFPFFPPIYRKAFTVELYSGHKADVSLESVLKGQMQEPNFPVSLGGLPASLTFREVHRGRVFDVPGARVRTVDLHHPNGASGARFEADGKVFVHLTDHEHGPQYDESIISFVEGADILSMDTMYTPEEYETHVGWGHSSWLHACRIARQARVGKLILFHHDPSHDDEFMDEIGKNARKEFPETLVAYEGLELEL